MNGVRRSWILGLIGVALLATGPALFAQEGQDPSAGHGALQEARQLRRAGRLDQALACVDAQLSRTPDDAALAGLRGLVLLDARRQEQAAALYQHWSAYDGDEFRMHLFLGRFLQLAGDSDGALPRLQRAAALQPEAVEPLVLVVQALLATGKCHPALAQAERLEALAPDVGRPLAAQALVMQAQRYRAKGEEQLFLAIDSYRAALDRQPRDLAIVRELLDTLLDATQADAAQALLEQHFDSRSDPLDWHFFTGRCHAVRLELEAAEQELSAARREDPRHVPTLIELAKLALDANRFADALEAASTATEAEPRSARAWLLRGQAHEALADDDAAEFAYRRACELGPAVGKAHYLLGRLLIRTGHTDEGGLLVQQSVTAAR